MQNDTLGPGSRLISAQVLDPDGAYLGSIEELLIDWSKGQIRFVVVCLDGAHRRQSARILLPWEVLRLDTRSRAFISKAHEGALEQVAQRVDGSPPGADKDDYGC